jgi:hypothetical protein
MRLSTRTFLELRVGTTHTVEVLLHVRHKDRAWFSPLRDQFLHLLTTRVIPREFGEEIEAYHEALSGDKVAKPGEANEKQKRSANSAQGKGKRKRKTKATQVPVIPVSGTDQSRRRDIRHVFGDNGLQLTYRLQDMDVHGCTTISISSHDSALEFRQYPKLSKRLVVWCFPLQNDATEPDPVDGGFPRPELVPIAALFRSEHAH